MGPSADDRREGGSMPDLIIFNVLIPLTDNRTGIVHPPEKFDDWVMASVFANRAWARSAARSQYRLA